MTACLADLSKRFAKSRPAETKALILLPIQMLPLDGRGEAVPTHRFLMPVVCADA